MNLNIRNALKNDLNLINEIAKQVHNLHVELRPDIYVPNDIVISEERYNELLAEGIVLVGEIDNQIVSYAVCFIRDWNNPVMARRKVMFIDAIGNDENFRNCGIGKKMMDHIINYAKEINCDRVELQVIESNKNAMGFYEHMGMKEKSRTLEMNL